MSAPKMAVAEATANGATLTPTELDLLAQTPITDVLSPEVVSKALASPPFVLVPTTEVAQVGREVRGANGEEEHGTAAAQAVAPVACLNFRDVASPTRTPEAQPGRIYRAAMSAFAPTKLAQLGIVKVHDLRSEAECTREPHVGFEHANRSGVSVVWEPPVKRDFAPTTGPDGLPAPPKHPDDVLPDAYMQVLSTHQAALRSLLLSVASLGKGEAVLLHCTAGKDRTGVAVAMLLSLAGCSHASIASEYALTRIGVESGRQRLQAVLQAMRPGTPLDDPGVRALAESRAKDMLRFLRRVDESFEGGFAGYARDVLGVDEDVLQRVRERLCKARPGG